MKRVDLEVAVAAGLAVAFPLYMIFTLTDACGTPARRHGAAIALLVALPSYLSVPLLFGLLRDQWIARSMWLWTAVIGSFLSAVALNYLGTHTIDWGLDQFAKVWLALCVWTLPFAAVVYYSGMIIRGIRRRLEGS